MARSYDRRVRDFGAGLEDDFPYLGQVLTGREALLDLGCGAGGSLRRFLAWHGAPRLCVGIDLAERMVRSAAATAAPVPCLWVVADAESLPFPPDSFDIVIAVNSLSHLQDLEGALAGAARLLRSGGRIALRFRDSRTLARPIEVAFRRALASVASGARLRGILDMYRPPSTDRVLQTLRAADVVSLETRSGEDERFLEPEPSISRFIAIAAYMLDMLEPSERDLTIERFRAQAIGLAGPHGIPDFDAWTCVSGRRAP